MEEKKAFKDRKKKKDNDRHRAKAAGGGAQGAMDMVRVSKHLSYLLRHGAEKEGLPMRADGFVRVEDIVRSSHSYFESHI
jgi:RNA:NAD 2'-phosphotransferase (TPT1/KptA family)